MLSGAIDAALGTSLLWLLQRRRRLTGPRAGELSVGWLLEPASTVLREQLASPGQLLLGLRTVDRRTGERVAAWRTAVLVGVHVGGQVAVRRLVPPPGREDDRRREAFVRRLEEISRLRTDDPARADAELLAARAETPSVGPYLLRMAGPAFIAAQLDRRLRRGLAPTVSVRRRGRAGARHR